VVSSVTVRLHEVVGGCSLFLNVSFLTARETFCVCVCVCVCERVTGYNFKLF
jgi:hypothetical protein